MYDFINFQPLRNRKPTDVALVTHEKIWRVSEIASLVKTLGDAFENKLEENAQFEGACRVVLPSSNAALYLAGLILCFQKGYSAVTWRNSDQGTDAIVETTTANFILLPDSTDSSSFSISLASASLCPHSHEGHFILMSSGSTGKPKGVALTPEQLISNAEITASEIEISGCDGWAIDIDLSLTSATCHLIMAWQANLPLYHFSGFENSEKEKLFEDHKIGFGGSPLQLNNLCKELGGEASPYILFSSGDFLSASMVDEISQCFPKSKLHKFYGLSELGCRFCSISGEALKEKKSAAGFPLPGFRASVDPQSGEVLAKSPMAFKGYYKFGGAFEPNENTWHPTGDIGEIDEDGAVTLLGRKDDVIKVGGEKVDRHSIEQALADLLDGHEFCVLGIHHQLIGHCPALFLSAGEKTTTPSWKEIVSHVRSKLPSRFVPSFVFTFDEPLPRLPNGKLNAVLLKNSYKDFKQLT